MLRRLIIGLLALVVVVLLAAAGALYWLLSGDAIRQALESQASSWLGEPVHIEAAHAQLWPRVGIDVTGVRVGDPARLTLSRAALSAPLRPLLSRRIEDADITVSRSRIDMPLPFSMPSFESHAPAGGAPAIQLVSIRSIALRDVVLASRGRMITVDAADSSLIGSELSLQRFTATSGRTQLDATGVVTLDPRVDARLRVTANRLDVDDLLALANAFAPPGPASAQSRLPVRIAARISAERATVGALEARAFATDLEVDGDTVTLSPVSLELFGGRYEGSINARLGRTITTAVRARLADIDVAQLAGFGGAPGAITGRLTAAGSFNGAGADFAAALGAARGTATASIVNGTIQHLDLVRTVVLFFGRPAPGAAPSSDRFDRIDARIILAQQIVRAEALSLHSADADIVGTGTLDLRSEALDGAFDLSLSEELSKQAGTDLFRYTHEGNRIVLPARLGGSVGSPHLSIDAAAAVKRGLKNEIQQRLGDILDRFKQQPPPAQQP